MTDLLEQRKWILFVLILFCHIYFFQIYPNFTPTNELSRLLLASAVMDDHSFEIDRANQRYGNSEDEARYQGHVYSDKAIGTSLVALPFLALLRLVESTFGVRASAAEAITFLRTFTITIPAILFLPFIARFWKRMRPDGEFVTESLFFLTFGTIAFTYSMQLISHYLMGILLFYSFGIVCLYKKEASLKQLVFAGIANGLALTMEYPAVLPVALICLYALFAIRDLKRVLIFALPVLACGLLMLAYNYAIFGSPFDVTYQHTIGRHTAPHATGIVGVNIPGWDAIYGLLFARHHGLFFTSPVLLLSLPGLFLMMKSKLWRAEGWLFAWISFSLLFIYAGFNYWIGGWAFGPRYLASAIPFLATGAYYAFTEKGIRSNRFLQAAVCVAGIFSVVMIVAGSITFPYPPDPLRDPSCFVSFPLMRNGGYGWNVASWLGFTHSGPAFLFFTILLITYLVAKIPSGNFELPGRSVVSRITVTIGFVVLLLIAGLLTSPLPTAKEFYARGLVYTFVGKYDLAMEDMKNTLQANPDEQMKTRAERAIAALQNAINATSNPKN